MSNNNYATDLYARQALLDKSSGEPPGWFRHLAPVPPNPAPDFGTLTSKESAEVSRWLTASQAARPGVLRGITQRAALDKVEEYKTYFADPVNVAYLDADRIARSAQWKLFHADALVDNAFAISQSGDNTGVGLNAPASVVPQAANTSMP